MPVSVSLLELIQVGDSRHIWPEQFRALVAKLEENPAERTQWKVIADWCREHEETALADACGWIARFPSVSFAPHMPYGSDQHGWNMSGLPAAFSHSGAKPRTHALELITHAATVAECMALLAAALNPSENQS